VLLISTKCQPGPCYTTAKYNTMHFQNDSQIHDKSTTLVDWQMKKEL